MRVSFIALVLAVVATAVAQNDPAKDELKKLEGTYRLVKGEEAGKPIDETIVKTAKLTITGDMHVVKLGDETIRGTHTVNPLEKPKSIDANDTTGRFADKMVKGIYKLDGDEFTICMSPPNEPRPLDFKTEGKAGRLMHVWKRDR